MRFRIRQLEERIAYDAALAADAAAQTGFDPGLGDSMTPVVTDADGPVAETSAQSTVPDHAVEVTDATIVEIQGDQGAGLRILVVSSEVQDAALLGQAAADDVEVVYYDASDATLAGIEALIAQTLDGRQADSIAFVNHGQEGSFQLTDSLSVSENSLSNNAELAAFWRAVGEGLTDNGRLDLLACDLAGNDAGLRVIAALDTLIDGETGDRTVAASTDTTANATSGGDWTLEVGAIDASQVYFNTTQLAAWTGDLATITVTIEEDVVDAADNEISLREAVIMANSMAGADTIVLPGNIVGGDGVFDLTIGGAGEDAAATGDLDITSDITIESSDGPVEIRVVDFTMFNDRIFHVLSGASLTLDNISNIRDAELNDEGAGVLSLGTLVVTDTTFSNNTSAFQGGGIASVEGTLTVTDSAFIENETQEGPGGGIYIGAMNTGVTITGTTFDSNIAADYGGGIAADNVDVSVIVTDSTFVDNSTNSSTQGGGGIYSKANLFVTGVDFRGNTATRGDGGGILADEGSLSVDDSEFVGNVSDPGEGGAIYIGELGNDVDITDTRFSENFAGLNGGGIAFYGLDNMLSVVDSEFTFNLTAEGDGGAIYSTNEGFVFIDGTSFQANTAAGFGGAIFNQIDLDVRESLFTENAANADPVLGPRGAAVHHDTGAPMYIHNSTFSGNGGAGPNDTEAQLFFNSATESQLDHVTMNGTNADTANVYIGQFGNLTATHTIFNHAAGGDNISGLVAAEGQGYNLFNNSPAAANYTPSAGATDLFNTDPTLNALADNGGKTLTHELAGGSPAIDAGDPGLAPQYQDGTTILFDQRDQAPFARVSGVAIDIGAYETQQDVPLWDIFGTIFKDDNPENAQLDFGEELFDGVTITLQGDGPDGIFGTADDLSRTEISDAFGFYFFADVPQAYTYRLSYIAVGDVAGTSINPDALFYAGTYLEFTFDDRSNAGVDEINLPLICPMDFSFIQIEWDLEPLVIEPKIFGLVNPDNPDPYIDWEYLEIETAQERVADFFADQSESLREYLGVWEDPAVEPVRDEAHRSQYDFRGLHDFFDYLERRGLNMRGLNNFWRYRVDIPYNK